MIETLALKAFIVGIVSALSLVLGAVASFFWRPGDRTIAFLMAVGGGALLAALTLDLVGEAIERGHYISLCSGCVIGGLLFISLDQIVSDYGGFLRKAATTVYHVRRQKHRQYKRILSNIGRTDVFKHLTTRDFKSLSASIQSRDYEKGDVIYQIGDPSEDLYILISGEVELFKSTEKGKWSKKLGVDQAFGRLAFITGAPHASAAVASTDVSVLTVPRNGFDALLLNSSTLQQVMHRWLRSSELQEYLCRDHTMSLIETDVWINAAVQSLINRGRIPTAVVPERQSREFLLSVDKMTRLAIFAGLPADEIETISSHMLLRRYHKRQTVYHHGDRADRIFIVLKGEISLIDGKSRGAVVLQNHNIFGGYAFFSGARHSVTAMATQETQLWMLRKRDFEELLTNLPVFREKVIGFLQDSSLVEYLVTKQHLDRDKALRFVQSSAKEIELNHRLMSVLSLTRVHTGHSSAGVAIWLGIMLDGIPESLVIGSSMVQAHLSMSLLVGLFIANFPEALSSSLSMRQQGLSHRIILLMWISIVLITGIGAAVGSIFFDGAQPFVYAVIEGIAAGAMLTMIAQTMMPEAYFRGGSIVGFATLLGFLAAILSKMLG